jgi:hypothetical protein
MRSSWLLVLVASLLAVPAPFVGGVTGPGAAPALAQEDDDEGELAPFPGEDDEDDDEGADPGSPPPTTPPGGGEQGGRPGDDDLDLPSEPARRPALPGEEEFDEYDLPPRHEERPLPNGPLEPTAPSAPVSPT